MCFLRAGFSPQWFGKRTWYNSLGDQYRGETSDPRDDQFIFATRNHFHKIPVQVGYRFGKGVVRPKVAAGISLYLPGWVITSAMAGADFFVEACRILAEAHPEWRDTLGVAAFGSGSAALEGMLPFPVYVQDYVANEKDVVDLYNAVDVFVLPSLEENLPNMVMEAMACGVPCVAFHTGGVPEMVDHLHNGYVARYRDAADLANGIHWVLGEGGYQGLSEQACRKAVSSYSENIVAKRYIDVYNRITGSHG